MKSNRNNPWQRPVLGGVIAVIMLIYFSGCASQKSSVGSIMVTIHDADRQLSKDAPAETLEKIIIIYDEKSKSGLKNDKPEL